MKGTNSLKGSHSIKTMQSLKKDSETSSQQGPDFLKMYMLEKERTRLRSERTRLLLRLDPIEARLKEIDAYYVDTLGPTIANCSTNNQNNEQDEDKIEWNTVGINY